MRRRSASRTSAHAPSSSRHAMALFLALGAACLLILVAASGASGQPGEGAVDEDPDSAPYVAGELIVVYEEAPARSLLRAAEGTVEEDLPSVGAQLVGFPEIKREASKEERERLLEEKRRELEGDPSVKSADYNYERQFFAVPNDPRFERQWHLRGVSAPRAWNTETGAGASIAVIDSGIDTDHPDLSGKIDLAESAQDGGDAKDDTGHGTHVAGIAAASTNNGAGVAGACPECRLMVAKVNDRQSPGVLDSAAIIAAIDWSVENGSDVINMSFGGAGASGAERDAVDRAWEAGSTLVAAAGNENTNTQTYPAAYENVIAVSATTRRDTKAGYSNFGGWIDVAAPGGANVDDGRIHSTIPRGYGNQIGTSMSSPVVAGAAGLLAGQGLPNTEVRDALQSTAADLGPAGEDNTFGHGRVDAAAAVGASAPQSANTPPRIVNPRPRPAARLSTRVAAISAAVRDSQTELRKKDIRLIVDGKRVDFTYNAANDKLTRKIKIAPGRHRASVIATDEEGARTVKAWGFSTTAPRPANNRPPGQSVSQNVSINQSP